MYSEQELFDQPLIDDDQWGRLKNELGFEMLQEFTVEFFEETEEIWFVSDFNPLAFEEKAFKSMAHRSAGAAGTIGLKRLRYAFLCMEHNPLGEQTFQFLNAMKTVFADTKAWVGSQSQ
jgi:HPt (histidine-containing phosphotransfer) domain-containing protein